MKTLGCEGHGMALRWDRVLSWPFCDENMTFDLTDFRWCLILVGHERRRNWNKCTCNSWFGWNTVYTILGSFTPNPRQLDNSWLAPRGTAQPNQPNPLPPLSSPLIPRRRHHMAPGRQVASMPSRAVSSRLFITANVTRTRSSQTV